MNKANANLDITKTAGYQYSHRHLSDMYVCFVKVCKKINDKQRRRFGFTVPPHVAALTLPAALHCVSWGTANGKYTISNFAA